MLRCKSRVGGAGRLVAARLITSTVMLRYYYTNREVLTLFLIYDCLNNSGLIDDHQYHVEGIDQVLQLPASGVSMSLSLVG